jgi:hypothetical protein
MGVGGRMGTGGKVLLVGGSESGALRLVNHTSKTSSHVGKGGGAGLAQRKRGSGRDFHARAVPSSPNSGQRDEGRRERRHGEGQHAHDQCACAHTLGLGQGAREGSTGGGCGRTRAESPATTMGSPGRERVVTETRTPGDSPGRRGVARWDGSGCCECSNPAAYRCDGAVQMRRGRGRALRGGVAELLQQQVGGGGRHAHGKRRWPG